MLLQRTKISLISQIALLFSALVACEQPQDERTNPPPAKSLDLTSRSFCGDTTQTPPTIERRFRVE